MRRFLRETWELWYWAMFLPSRLQARMNEWAPAEEEEGRRPDTRSWDILLFRFNFRFFSQYLLLISCSCLPLLSLLLRTDHLLDWLLFPTALLTAYGLDVLLLPLGIHVPILFGLIYATKPAFYVEALQKAMTLLPPLSQLTFGLTVGGFALGITVAIGTAFLEQKQLALARSTVWLGSSLSVALGTGLATHNLVSTLVVTGLTGFLLYSYSQESINTSNDASGVAIVIASGVAIVIAIGVAIGVASGVEIGVASGVEIGVVSGVASGVASGVEIGVATLATLPAASFLFAVGLIAWSLSFTQGKQNGWIIAGIFFLLGVENLGIQALWVVPVALICYHRLIPDALLSSLISLSVTLPWIRRFVPNPFQNLLLLPPHTSELLWIPLPRHDQLLAAAFHKDASRALVTFQKMQVIPIPGFQLTLKRAIPQIVADQLVTLNTTPDLLISTTPNHPVLPLLIPAFYQPESDTLQPVTTNLAPELSILLPRLQTTAKDLEAALQSGSAALRERGLERILNNLNLLQAQLPGLGLKPAALNRWKPVVKRWQHLVQLEIEQQQRQSQGELLDPFQYGNPLRKDRSYLFKGRQAFADRLVSLILDRNRPTLVLHGPRRCGKTSFLLNLPRLLPSAVVPIYLDLQSAAISTDEAAFCQGLTRAIAKDSRSQGLTLPPVPDRPTFQKDPYITLEDWLDQAMPMLGDRRLLLNLDEFEKIGSALQAGKFSLDLLNELRHLIQHYDAIGFLFSGVQTLNELGPNWSSYFISVVPIEMLYLEPNEAEALLTDPDPDFELTYELGIIPEILHLTRCQPYLLQLMGASLVTQANQNHTQHITPTLLQAAIQTAFTNGEPYFTNVWTEFTGNTPLEITAGQTLLKTLATGQPLQNPDPTQQAALQKMVRYHILEQILERSGPGNDRYQFEIPLLEQWVRERAILQP